MKSRYGFWAGVIFVAALPLALLLQAAIGVDAEAVVHFAFAAGCGLLVAAARDFSMPTAIRIMGMIAAALLGSTFLLQGLSNCIENQTLHNVAFDILGQWPERILVDSVLIWLAAFFYNNSRGKLRILGLMTFAACVAVELCNVYLNFQGTAIHIEFPILKIVFLTPFVWLLLESRTEANK